MILRKIATLSSAVVLGLGLLAGSASAATVFAFGGPGGDLGATETFVEDGITLDVTSSGGNIHRNVSGLGVVGAPDGNRLGNGESLTFSFTPSVTLLSSIVFEHSGGNERFRILDSASAVLGTFTISGSGTSNSFVTLDDLDLTGGEFTFLHLAGSGIRISELTVAPVPLPAGLPLVLAAVGGLGFLARRRKSV